MAKKYKQREMAHRVKVETAPNGYSLDIDGNGYMYFTLAELVEGFFIHVGLGIVDYCDEQTMRDLITACGTFPKEGQAIQAVAGLQAKIEALEQSHRRDFREIETRKLQNLKLAEELQKTKKRLNYYLSEEKTTRAKADANTDDTKPKKDWKKDRLHKDEVVTPKKIIKVKPGPPIDKPAKVERRGRPPKQAPKKDDHEELEKRLREKGVLK